MHGLPGSSAFMQEARSPYAFAAPVRKARGVPGEDCRPRRRRRLLFLGVAFYLLGTTRVSGQTPLFFDDIGCGPRAVALGQAFTAVADDASAAYYNPAGLVQIPSRFSLSMGYMYAKPKISIRVLDKAGNPYRPHYLLEQRDPNRSEDRSTGGMYLGITSNFGHLAVFQNPPSFVRNVSLGFVFFYGLPNINTFWNPQRKQDPYHLRYNNGYCLMSMAMSVGYRIADWVSVGVGVMPRMDTFQNTLDSFVDVSKLVNDPSDAFRLRLKTRLEVHAEWILGVLLKPPWPGLREKLALGVSFRRELSGYYGTGFSGDDVVYLDPVTGDKILLFPINTRSVDYIGYNPAQLTVGLAVKPLAGVTISTDLTWKDYSKFRFFWALPPEPRFHDVWVPRVGVEYDFDPGLTAGILKKVSLIRIMAGYYFEPSPVPDMNGPMNILDSDLHVASVGLGLDYRMKGVALLKLQSHFKMHFAETRVLANDRDPLFGLMSTGGEVYSGGFSLAVLL